MSLRILVILKDTAMYPKYYMYILVFWGVYLLILMEVLHC